ncbi:RING finger protein 212B-like [Corticium candelabrum]|uniref:RING finger protein 212B-like n=1 Tax=Corticium candelabrum TaxID=121492 RepID=UPI002E260371|nr:RING finger protein 212B-like [Corticium candelabrum]
MDWVHCNSCYIQPPAAGRRFCLTSCGHIFCDRCQQQSESRSSCRLCGASCSTIVLSTKMKPEVEMYFTDPAETVKKATKNVLQVLDFQKSHRLRFLSHLKTSLQHSSSDEIELRVKALEQDNQVLRQKGQTLVNENQTLKSECQLLRDENVEIKRLLASRAEVAPSSGGRHFMQTVMATPSPSPGHRALSPMRCSQSSPIGGLHTLMSTPRSRQNLSCYSQQVPQTPSGPVRVSIRTPPSGGKMGTVPSNSTAQRRLTPGSSGVYITRKLSTPCIPTSLSQCELSHLVTPNNSLSASQLSHMQSQSVPLSASQIGRSVRSPSPSVSSRMEQRDASATEQWDPLRRQICLRYQHRNESRRPLLVNSVGYLSSQSTERS